MSRARGFLANILGEQTGGILGSQVSALPQTQAPPAPTGQPQAPSATNRLFQNPAFLAALNSFGQALVQPGQVPGQAINTGQRLVQGLGAFNQQFGQQQQAQQLQQQERAKQALAGRLTEAQIAQAEATTARLPGQVELKEREAILKEKQFGLKQREFEQEVKEFETKAIAGGLDPKELFDRGTKLRGEFTNLSKEFIKQRDAFGRVQASADDPSAAGDLALVFNFMKVLDPGSTVREGEFATAARAAGLGERIIAAAIRVDTGKILSPQQRKDFTDRAGKLFDEAAGQHDQRVNTFTSLAGRLGVDPQNVILDLGIARKRAAEEQAVENIPTGGTINPAVTTQAQFDALPSGALFTENGQTFRKP